MSQELRQTKLWQRGDGGAPVEMCNIVPDKGPNTTLNRTAHELTTAQSLDAMWAHLQQFRVPDVPNSSTQ